MRTRGILVAITIAIAAAGCDRAQKRGASASASPSAPASTGASATPVPSGVPSLICEVVMVDPANRRIVLRTPSASGGGTAVRERSLPVSGPALEALPTLRPKDQVAVVCADSAAVPRSTGPAGGNDGIGPVATGEELATCDTVISLTKVATPVQ
jgi:hypothetical protein